jgi:hypothetical protein
MTADPRALRKLAESCNETARYVRIAVDSAYGLGRFEEAAELERLAAKREEEARQLNDRASELEAGLKRRAELFGVACEIASTHQGN